MDSPWTVHYGVAMELTDQERRWRAAELAPFRGRWTADNPPKVVQRFVRWYVHDRLSGQTLIDWAAECGYSARFARQLQRDERVIELLDRELRTSNAGPIRVQAVMDMLYTRATVKEDVKAAQLYLQAVDRLSSHTKVDVIVTDARKLSDEQLAAELRRAVALVEGRRELPVVDAEVISDSRDGYDKVIGQPVDREPAPVR